MVILNINQNYLSDYGVRQNSDVLYYGEKDELQFFSFYILHRFACLVFHHCNLVWLDWLHRARICLGTVRYTIFEFQKILELVSGNDRTPCMNPSHLHVHWQMKCADKRVHRFTDLFALRRMNTKSDFIAEAFVWHKVTFEDWFCGPAKTHTHARGPQLMWWSRFRFR